MIWRHVKQRMARIKLQIYIFFILNLWKWKRFLPFSPWNNRTQELIFALYKYSRRLLTRTGSPKLLSNNLSLWLSYDWLLPIKFWSSQISYCTISYWFQKVILLYRISLSRHEQVLTWRVNLLYYEHWTDKQKYFYVILLFLSYLSFSEFDTPSWKYANEFASTSDK